MATKQELLSACAPLLVLMPEQKAKLLAAAKQQPGGKLDAALSTATVTQPGRSLRSSRTLWAFV